MFKNLPNSPEHKIIEFDFNSRLECLRLKPKFDSIKKFQA